MAQNETLIEEFRRRTDELLAELRQQKQQKEQNKSDGSEQTSQQDNV